MDCFALIRTEMPGMGRGCDLVIAKGGFLGWLMGMMLSISENTLSAGCPVQKKDTEIIFQLLGFFILTGKNSLR